MVFYPQTLWYLFILIPIITIMIIRYLKGRQDLKKIAGSWREQIFYDLYSIKSFFIALGTIIFIVFAILSLAGFSGDESLESFEPNGTDLIFVTDISNSMNAQDVTPSRLKKANLLIRSICENIPNTSFGVVAFKGQAIKIVPVTEDTDAIYLFLNIIDSNLISTPGSNIQSGIETALASFTKEEERRKYIILLSDGESLSGEAHEAAQLAKEQGVYIISIGVGTQKGSHIPNLIGDKIKDNNGKLVISKLNEQPLKQLAYTTGGSYHLFSDPLLLPEIIKTVSDQEEKASKKYKKVLKEKYRFFLIISLTGLFISVFVKRFRWKDYF